MCLIMRTGWVAGLLETATGECSFVLDIMTGNRSVLVRCFTGLGGCRF